MSECRVNKVATLTVDLSCALRLITMIFSIDAGLATTRLRATVPLSLVLFDPCDVGDGGRMEGSTALENEDKATYLSIEKSRSGSSKSGS